MKKQSIGTRSKTIDVKKLTLSAMFMALGLVLPFFTGQIQQIGSMLLPMHLPVFLCGMVCGGGWGGIVGFILPILRYALFGMPPIFPKGIAMAFELATYGIVAGLLYQRSKWHCYRATYRCLIIAMIVGRLVWGVVYAILCGMAQQPFTFKLFVSGAFLEAIPGIILQLLVIPVLVKNINKLVKNPDY